MALRLVTGFRHRTTAGWVTGNAGNKFADAVTGDPAIVTVNSREWLEVSAAAGSENLRWTTDTLATSQNRIAFGVRLRFQTTVPTAQILVQIDPAAGLSAILFINGSAQLGAGFEGGTTTTGPTLVADTDYYVEVHLDLSANPHVLDWVVDTVAQTQVTQGQALSTVSVFALGTSNSETWTGLFTDLIVWTDTADITPFPFGKHKVQLLSVDPAGTLLLGGGAVAGDFNTFTSNGTAAAWNATTARNNIDETPATIGASADGFMQITSAAGNPDYVEIPMTSYTLAAGETVLGVRMLAVGWAASALAATLGFRSHNGTTETVLFAAADPNFDTSTTVPAWVCKMLTTADIDTQAELDALVFRVGFSTDANPTIGIHAIWAEGAIKESTSVASTFVPAIESQRIGYF